ncbi:MAG: DUF4287 domain-containing protein [Ornithinimicrobium sp.]
MSDQLATMIANLETKTGRSLESWVVVAERSRLGKHGEIVRHLKSEHGLTHGYANLIANTTLERHTATGQPGDLIEAQYTGKENLRPIYDALVRGVQGFGDDVEVAPKKTGVSLRRAKQFALITPASRARVDLGLNAAGAPATDRLREVSGMCSHKVGLASVEDVDDELLGWLHRAYEAAAPRS